MGNAFEKFVEVMCILSFYIVLLRSLLFNIAASSQVSPPVSLQVTYRVSSGQWLAYLWHGWHGEPSVVLGILLASGAYLWGTRTLWRRRGGRRTLPWWRAVAFVGSMFVLAIALLSPLDALSGDLLSAHMIQHLLLLIVAPLLLVIGRPLLVMRWSLPLPMRRRWVRVWRQRPTFVHMRWVFVSPVVAAAIYAVVLWLWHVPAFYEAALYRPAVHILEHISFFAAAALLWWIVIFPGGGKRHYGISIVLLFITALQGTLLGALLTFSTVLWYPANSPAALAWGMTPLGDQQLAGLLMWVPPGILYLGTIAVLFGLWLAALEHGLRRRERAQQRVVRPLRLADSSSRPDGG